MPHTAENRFQKVISSQIDIHSSLPLIHITDAYSFMDIIAGSTINPTKCPVFKEPLTYMFYGRPSYQTKHTGNNFLSANLPVAFVFHPEKLDSICREVYPFDTGAFCAGLYNNFFHSRSEVNHFKMPGSIESAQKIVGYFYRSNEEYFHGGSRKNVEVPRLNFEVEGVHELARLTTNQQSDGLFKPDLRSSSIELIFDSAVDLTSGLLGMIVPQICLDDDELKSAINDLNPKYISTYNGIHNIGSNSLLGILFDKTYDIYKKEKVL